MARTFAGVFLAGIFSIAIATPAQAVSFRYSTSNNRIYVQGGGSATLTDIKAALPSAPLSEVTPGVWYLQANLNITDGSSVVLHGRSIGGDVDELRLQSNNDSSGFVIVTADYGTIDIDTTSIKS